MVITILFFGATAKVVGRRRVEIDIESNSKASKIFGKLVADYPSLTLHKLHFSINEQFATGDEIIQHGDELAVFTAVSGG